MNTSIENVVYQGTTIKNKCVVVNIKALRELKNNGYKLIIKNDRLFLKKIT